VVTDIILFVNRTDYRFSNAIHVADDICQILFGGMRAYMEDGFDNTIFVSGFFVNTFLAAGLAYIGDKLGVELYLAAVVVFGVRIFQNLAIIRRYLVKKY